MLQADQDGIFERCSCFCQGARPHVRHEALFSSRAFIHLSVAMRAYASAPIPPSTCLPTYLPTYLLAWPPALSPNAPPRAEESMREQTLSLRAPRGRRRAAADTQRCSRVISSRRRLDIHEGFTTRRTLLSCVMKNRRFREERTMSAAQRIAKRTRRWFDLEVKL